jgi:hypothetical protein
MTYSTTSYTSFANFINQYSVASGGTAFAPPINEINWIVTYHSITNLNVYFMTDGANGDPT